MLWGLVLVILASSYSPSVSCQPIKTLIMAVAENNNVAVSTLLQKGAEVDSSDGLTALLLAAQDGRNEIVTNLIAHNASTDIQDNDGLTALMYAAIDSNNVVSTLLAHNADVDIQNNYGETYIR